MLFMMMRDSKHYHRVWRAHRGDDRRMMGWLMSTSVLGGEKDGIGKVRVHPSQGYLTRPLFPLHSMHHNIPVDQMSKETVIESLRLYTARKYPWQVFGQASRIPQPGLAKTR